ncbi:MULTISPECIES: glycine betaine/L-proline ABC transporter ATP-binding protein [unclassified Cryobacterium]|uniref:quaternary amine ABC transporter ATP-binding protein n=1 Tax=unclassified Cryobacterium TaxID=2649013 RepID=UPI002AB446F8|nr:MULTISPECIES: glycine betaine/L-proline ABC transporter ATP-binding protein [unclassified Cryobacterium]MDY7528224.1 glycine betaine/L-proline ABC transporter ATP-binding protein [Cryobacterium sp. 10C2]MDY7556031.1 glycine betaine/L-proline ABC transporter ATP-binding protein [Cryobacterium sp. 10C3]MEB0002377.1 glycine betaine/L-proline ABC transporter ATP-binding protein [Cryobacterium sp. RTC2.1]MEB0289277.1 glycine betaine/L-proline ABC transporter ATP-binding protein [Cryobacterium sp.
MAVKADHLYKAFGRRPHDIVKKLEGGASREDLAHLGTAAVIDASFEVRRGEIFVVMGLSGSGKSTLIRMLNGLLEATSGTVTVGDTRITGLPAAKLRDVRRRSVSMVFQHFALLPHRSVIDNVAYGLEVQGMPRAERLAKARTIIRLVGLDGWADSMPSELSGGMQQRVGLGRALAADTDVLLMDEAFSALDPLIRREMQEQLIELQAELGKTIIFITHDLNEAMFLGDRIAVMRDGRIVQIGTPEDILTDPANDYVAQFVQDVDRARVLTAGSVMEPVRSMVTVTSGPRAALRTMRDLQTSATFVVGRDLGFVGVVRDRDVLKQVKASHPDLRPIIKEATAVSADTALVDLVELAVESDLPIAVVDARNRLLGVIPRVTLLAAFGNVTTATGEVPVTEPPSTISHRVITETLRETALEGAQL